MHFRAEMTVMLDTPLPIAGEGGPDESAIGYLIVIGVNAPDLAMATQYAHDVASRPKQADGTFRSFEGSVPDANIRRLQKTDWEPVIQQNAKRIDQEGVYYSTGLIFFSKDE